MEGKWLLPGIFKNDIWAGDSLQDRSKNRRGQSLIGAHIWKIPIYLCVVCVVVFSSHSFWTSMNVPAGVTQEEGHTGFLIHLLSAVHALLFLARRIQPFLSLVDREVESCVLTILIVLPPLGIFFFF